MSDGDVLSLVGNERQALDATLFTLTTLRLHLEESGSRWVGPAADALERSDASRRAATLERCVLGGPDLDAPLAGIAAVSPTPVDGLLAELREAMQRLVREIEAERAIVLVLLSTPDRAVPADQDDLDAALARHVATEGRRRARALVESLDLAEIVEFVR